jgi:Domain of unknown function (DUF4335)
MTIQRQYSLPNCKLVLQGLSNETADLSGRPLLSLVTNVECYLAGQKTPLTGGRAFLESLATAVSDYAQGYLSGIQHLVRRDRRQQLGLVHIEPIGENLHRLTVQPEADQPGAPSEVNLTTVQLFDLVEAVDQLLADGQTLPELGLKLEPMSKRHVMSQEPIAQRVVPAAIGASSLAAAAALLFMVPVPEVRRPETAAQTTATEQTSPSPVATGSPTPTPDTANATDTADATDTVSPSPTDAASPTASPDAATPANQGAGFDLASTPEITDPVELDRLTVQLYDRLDLAWQKTPTFDGSLIYRVGVNPEGNIVGYKFTNDASLTYLADTPLAEVQFDPPASSSSEGAATPEANTAAEPETGTPTPKQPVAQFRVVFKSDGVLEVSPWNGQPTDPTAEGAEGAEPTQGETTPQ